MTKYLRFMRHGATALNVADCWQGRADSPLTELGRRQAAEAGAHIAGAGIEPDHVYCSPKGRVVETLACALPSVYARGDYELDAGFVEIGFGSLDGKKHKADEPQSPYLDSFLAFGGESEDDVERRVCAAAERLMLAEDARDVLVVSHGSCGRIFRNHWAALARVEAPRHLANCCVYTYEFDEEARTFSLVDIYEPELSTSPEDFIAAR